MTCEITVSGGRTETCSHAQDSAQNPDDVIHHADLSESASLPSILTEAHRLVNGDRGRDYGPPWIDHQRVADIVNAWTGSDLSATDVQRVLVAVKLARMAESPRKRDHYVDAAGYLDCLWRTIERTDP